MKKLISNGYMRASLITFTFITIFIANFFFPFSDNYSWPNYDSRAWDWTILLLVITALFFILKYRKLNMKYLFISIGLACLAGIGKYLWFQSVKLLILDCFQQAIIFYGAYLIYENTPTINDKIHLSFRKIIRSFCLGTLFSIPFAILNAIYFSLSGSINLGDFFKAAFQALQPAIAEEIPFRFFLFGFLCYQLSGKVNQKFFTFFTYFMMIVPHSLLHLPSLFLISPVNGIIMLVLSSVLFGLPMAILMVKKNLPTAIGFHWFIDFLRFFLGF